MLYYYDITLLGLKLPPLTYHFKEELELGRVVQISLKGSKKEGVIVAKREKIELDTKEILKSLDFIYRPWQLDTAKFISQYYFSTLGEALNLFQPFKYSSKVDIKELNIAKLPTLSSAQLRAYNKLERLDIGLLFGVTGSGKSEIYITQIAKKLKEGKSAILLMPEISLTPQMKKRLKKYFGDSVAIWHSKLTKTKKQEILEGIYNSKIRVVAGARSALFVPLDNLGLIIVDEEHDDSYKSMMRPRYHARDLALYIAKRLKIQVWLGSATPSVTSFKKYQVVRLKEPYIKTNKYFKFVDGDGLTPQILDAIKKNLARGEQTLVFIPTRANFKYLWCENCGKTHKCPYCSVGMSLHRKSRLLRCHYCGFAEKIREECSYCGYSPLKSDRVGTQEVIEVLEREIKGAKVEQFDKDAITTPKKLEDALKRIEEGKSNIIVGTQMLSKGHDYPNITLSVILGLDYLMGLGDFRARERAIALLHQIAGRSGRSKDALILIQSSLLRECDEFIRDYENFIKDELDFREVANYPPFSYLARVLISNRNRALAKAKLDSLVETLEGFKEVEIIGFGSSPIERISNKWRYMILLRSNNRLLLLKALHFIYDFSFEIDMEPIDFS